MKLSVKLDAMSSMTLRHTSSSIIIDRPPMKEGILPLRGIIIDRPVMEVSKLPSSSSASSSASCQALVILFLPSRTPLRVWRWVTNFLQRFARKGWIYWTGLRVIQAMCPFDSNVLGEIAELVKKCCFVENEFTLQISSWGIFYHNGDSFHFLEFKEGEVPVNTEARWNSKRTGITFWGLHLNGAQITVSTKQTSTFLRSIGPPSKGRRNLDEMHIPIPIEELKGVKSSCSHAAKVVEFDGISLVVRSEPSFIFPSKSSLKEILQDGFQKILPLVVEMTKPILKSILDLKTEEQLLVEYWNGVLQMEMIECRNKVIILFQNLLASEISTFNGAHSLCFIPMCLSSGDKEYWQRALYDLSEDHLSIGSSSQSSTIHSTRGRIHFLLGEFDWALLDFDCALNSNMDGLASTLLDRAMVKCVLNRHLEAMQDINMAAQINPSSSNLRRFQACLEDMILCMDSSKSSTPLLQPTQPVYDLLIGDHHRNLDSSKLYYGKMPPILKSMEECGPSSIPDWTEVREPGSKDLPELDRLQQQGTSHNHDFPQLLLKYLNLDGYYDSLRTGEKLAEGGQAEIFKALGTPPQGTQTNLVLKVFKQAFPSQSWLQPDVLQFGGVFLDHPSPLLCTALGVKFLEDGRCAFVFPQHWGDLRRLIHQQTVTLGSPFEFRTSVKIMLQIAEGMRSLHIRNILHRDLKASNVLVSGDNPDGEDFRCLVADFECSVGVTGTSFWRAPEILTQLNQISEPEDLAWLKEADVYSFGMTCYEILTGDTPFKNLKASDWDVVLSGGRPQLPVFLDSKLRTLIELCWHDDPEERPNFSKICKVLADVKGSFYSQWRLKVGNCIGNAAGPAGHVQIHQESANLM